MNQTTYIRSGEYDALAIFYDALFGQPGLREEVIKASGDLSGKKVLEVACGTGMQTETYALHGARHVTGLDLSYSMLRQAVKKKDRHSLDKNGTTIQRAHLKNLNYLIGDGTKLPFGDEKFDIVTTTLSLHEMGYICELVVEEMKRVTKDDGRIVIADYAKAQGNFWSYVCGIVVDACEFGVGIINPPHSRNYKDFMRKGGLHALIERHNLRIVEERPVYGGNIKVLTLKPVSQLYI